MVHECQKYIRGFSPLCIWVVVATLTLAFVGCTYPKKDTETLPLPAEIDNVVIFGFRPVMAEEEEPAVLRSPISGAVFLASPVPKDTVNGMSTELFQRFLDKGYDVVSPDQAKGVYLNIIAREPGYDDMKVFIKVGEAFSSDAVLAGYLYRWKERVGADYAVTSPASVAFELYLVSPRDGSILWKGRFDKTQRSLSENLLDVETFLKSGGKWITADKLALIGLEDLLDDLFKRMGEKEE